MNILIKNTNTYDVFYNKDYSLAYQEIDEVIYQFK